MVNTNVVRRLRRWYKKAKRQQRDVFEERLVHEDARRGGMEIKVDSAPRDMPHTWKHQPYLLM